MATKLSGSPVAKKIKADLVERITVLQSKGIKPQLAIIRIGENDGDIFYERSAIKCCENLKIKIRSIVFPSDAPQDEVIKSIDSLNNDCSVHGVLILRPLPKNFDDNLVRNTLLPEKDVDGITESSLAGVFTGGHQGYCPCTSQACTAILDHYGINCAGKKVTVIGRSLVIGRPVAMLLMEKNATVTICHTKTDDLKTEIRKADIVIASAGKLKMVDADSVSPGQVIIDVGANADENGNMCGDVDTEAAMGIVDAITPVPGGVGSVTTSILALHVVEAAEKTIK